MNVLDLVNDEELAKTAADDYVNKLPDLPSGYNSPQGGVDKDSPKSPFDWIHPSDDDAKAAAEGFVDSLPDRE